MPFSKGRGVFLFSQNEITKQLKDLGIRPGHLIMVHASLRKLGPVEGGAEGVIHSLLSAIGKTGTLLMPLGSREGDIFDAKESLADPEIGVLAEKLRTFPGSESSDHAAARFCAFGSLKKDMLCDPLLHDYYDRGSLLDRFTQSDGKVLRLGADLDTTTLTHLAEYCAQVSPKRRVKRQYTKADIGEQWIESLDDVRGIQDWPNGDYFSQILIDFLAEGKARKGEVGQCRAEFFDAQVFLPYAVQWMETHLLVE